MVNPVTPPCLVVANSREFYNELRQGKGLRFESVFAVLHIVMWREKIDDEKECDDEPEHQ